MRLAVGARLGLYEIVAPLDKELLVAKGRVIGWLHRSRSALIATTALLAGNRPEAVTVMERPRGRI